MRTSRGGYFCGARPGGRARHLAVAAGLAACVAAAPAAAAVSAASGASAGGAQPPSTPAAAAAGALHPFNATDLQSMRRVSSPQASPRGDRVAFLVRTNDLGANTGGNDLWVVGIDGSGARALTRDHAGYDNPRWSPDGGTLYFLSSRSGSSQIWRISPVPGGAGGASAAGTEPGGSAAAAPAEQVTNLPVDVTGFALTADGTKAVLSADVFPDCQSLACTHDRLEGRAKSPVKARFYPDGTGFFRHWDTWWDGTRSHLFAVALQGGGTPIDLMRGMPADSPSKPFGGPEEYAITPDGRSVIFSARLEGRAERWSTNFDLFLVPIDGSAQPRDLTATNQAADTYPVLSPDGKILAYAAQSHPGQESDRYHLVIRDLATGNEHRIAEEWDRSVGPMFFSADGRTLYTTASDMGQNPLFAIDVANGKVRKLTAAGHIDAPALAGERLVFTVDDLKHPADIYTVRPDGSQLTQITHLNQERLASIQMGDYSQFHFTGGGGDTVYGWVVKPANFTPGKRYAVTLIIHGGPESAMDNHFHYRWNPEIYAGAGYGVVFIDFHGTPGYGQAFTDEIMRDWGGKPLEDLKAGLAAAIAANPWMDGDRACALGASYGGFMTNWIAGNWPDRFRCLVTHDGLFDQRMMYYATEEMWFPESEFGGPYFQVPEQYEKWNPARFVDRWKTPTLIVHGSLDYRIPDDQGLAAFTALQRRGVPSELLEFPNENHWVLKPADSLLWHQTVLSWLARWLNPPPGPPLTK